MAHPKLASVTRRSLLIAATAALVTGPLAVAGTAQNLETITNSATQILDLTCEQAKDTEDQELIDEFCPEEEGGSASSPEETVKSGGDTVTTTVEDTTAGDGGGDDGGGSTGGVPNPVRPSRDQESTGGSNFTPVDDSSRTKRRSESRASSSNVQSQAGSAFNANGPIRPGMSSYSELTLQPFAQPLVSVPPVYELPQIAEQMFGSTTATGVPDPAAATSATSFSGGAAGATDPAGWLAATATGLIMLVGAGHALTGGRMPKRQRS